MSESGKPLTDDDLGALGRWSQRKRRAARGEVLEDEPAVEERPSPAAVDAAPSDAGESELTDADMPPLESIDAHTDLAGFFSPKVSETLRRQALRRYFHLPDVHVVDRMNEYEGDYRSFQPLGDLVPEEMKRKLAHEAERLGKKLLEGGEESEQADDPDGERKPEIVTHVYDDKEVDG
ncbi:MAG: DUF3306 domain-containing protein [Acidihalobacter sp.]|jgi:hypothetical protein